MSYGQDAIKVIRANRSLLKKPKFKDIKNLIIKTSGKTELEFKQISKEKLEAIKLKIRQDAKRTAKRDMLIYGSCAIVLILLFAYLTFKIISSQKAILES